MYVYVFFLRMSQHITLFREPEKDFHFHTRALLDPILNQKCLIQKLTTHIFKSTLILFCHPRLSNPCPLFS